LFVYYTVANNNEVSIGGFAKRPRAQKANASLKFVDVNFYPAGLTPNRRHARTDTRSVTRYQQDPFLSKKSASIITFSTICVCSNFV